MVQFKELQTVEEWDKVWEGSVQKPLLLFKHSTTCPISAGAFNEYQSFLKSEDDHVDNFLVKVIENRRVSNKITEETGVKHESPQILYIKNKEVVWHTSHSKITAERISETVQSGT